MLKNKNMKKDSCMESTLKQRSSKIKFLSINIDFNKVQLNFRRSLDEVNSIYLKI